MHIVISMCDCVCVLARYFYLKFKELNFIWCQLLSCVFFPSLKSCISIRSTIGLSGGRAGGRPTFHIRAVKLALLLSRSRALTAQSCPLTVWSGSEGRACQRSPSLLTLTHAWTKNFFSRESESTWVVGYLSAICLCSLLFFQGGYEKKQRAIQSSWKLVNVEPSWSRSSRSIC